MKFLLWVIFFPLAFFSAKAQHIEASFLNAIPLEADAFWGRDVYGNLYYSKDQIFYKKSNDQTWQYRNLDKGTIKSVDIQNPLKIILFYQNFNAIILLDNQLNEISQNRFSEAEIPILCHATGMASQNKVWIFDEISQRIGLFDLLTNTPKLITTPLQNNMNHYTCNFNYFFWSDANHELWQTSIFGNIKHVASQEKVKQLNVSSLGHLFILTENEMILFDLKTDKSYKIMNYDKSIKTFSYIEQILSIFTGKEIKTYKINLP